LLFRHFPYAALSSGLIETFYDIKLVQQFLQSISF